MDIIIASLGQVGYAIEEMESHMAFLSEEDQASFREVVMAAIPDHGRFYDKDGLVNRVLGILSDDYIVADLDFSKLNSSQKNEISRLFWSERYLYEEIDDAKNQMKKILGK